MPFREKGHCRQQSALTYCRSTGVIGMSVFDNNNCNCQWLGTSVRLTLTTTTATVDGYVRLSLTATTATVDVYVRLTLTTTTAMVTYIVLWQQQLQWLRSSYFDSNNCNSRCLRTSYFGNKNYIIILMPFTRWRIATIDRNVWRQQWREHRSWDGQHICVLTTREHCWLLHCFLP